MVELRFRVARVSIEAVMNIVFTYHVVRMEVPDVRARKFFEDVVSGYPSARQVACDQANTTKRDDAYF